MKNFALSIVLFSVAAGCSNFEKSQVRNGPQAIHPSDWIRMQNGTMSAPSSNSGSEFIEITQSDACGAAQFQYLVGGPSTATSGLNIPDGSRHYGSEERVATDMPSRLNIVLSGTAIESVTNPSSTVLRVFCG